MSINNKDIHVKAYFRECLFNQMEQRRLETGESRSAFIQMSVAGRLQHGPNHSPVRARCDRPKVDPRRRSGAPTPIRQ